jgi:glycosyltransferase involved in cell wall biosynthesis
MRNRIRLLLLNYEYPPLGGGAGIATKNLFTQWSGNPDIQIDLISSAVGEYKEESISENIRIYYLDIGKKGRIRQQSLKDLLVYSWKSYFKMKELLDSNKYDLVHAFFGVPCGFIAMLSGKPYVISLRGSDVPYYSRKYSLLDFLFFRFLYKRLWGRARYVVANSIGLRDLAYRTISQYRIEVIPNGISLKEFVPMKKNDKFTVVSTSRLISRKGLNYLIEAFAQFAQDKDDVVLEMYNDGELRGQLEGLAKKLGVGDKVKFFGDIGNEQVKKVLGKGHVFVLPSLNEGMSNSLLEALASALAVIVTDVGGTRELVDDDNGFVVRKKSSKDILKALEIMYSDRKMVERMGDNSRKRVESMDWSSIADEYFNLYESVVND